MHILAITPDVPFPPDQGGRIRMHHLLSRLAHNHEVHLAGITDNLPRPEVLAAVKGRYASASFLGLPRSSAFSAMRLLQSLMSWKAFVLYRNRPFGLKTFLSTKIAEKQPDVLLMESPYFVDAIPSRLVPAVVDFHHLDHLMYARFAQERRLSLRKLHGIAQKPFSISLEKRVPTVVDRCVTVSNSEAEELGRVSASSNIRVVPNGVDLEFFTPSKNDGKVAPSSVADIVFVGTLSFYPNRDGVIFLLHHIMPEVWTKNPQATVNIVGRDPGDEMKTRERDPRVHIIGGVEDIRPYVSGAAVVVVPLRMGSGTRLKALEAAAMAKPIVGTSIGLEGLQFVDGVHAYFADQPQDFADRVRMCLDSPLQRDRLGDRARQLVEAKYGWDACARRLEAVLEEAASLGEKQLAHRN